MDTCKAIRDIRQEGYDEGYDKGYNEGYNEGYEEGYDEGVLMMLGDFVCEGILTVEDAAKCVRLTPEEFERKLATIQKR